MSDQGEATRLHPHTQRQREGEDSARGAEVGMLGKCGGMGQGSGLELPL